MKHSPLQLLRYVVSDSSCSANLAFNPEKEYEGGTEQLTVNSVVTQQKTSDAEEHSWSVEMTICQKLKEKQNFPYQFNLTIIGFFNCKNKFPSPTDEEQFVRVNGGSILYGAARELVRSSTCRGPWGELFLPTVSFYEKSTEAERPQTPGTSG